MEHYVVGFVAYIQQAGRGGRTGMSCEAILYYNMEDLGKQSISHEMKQYCHLTSCRRLFIAEHFGSNIEPNNMVHACCDNCKGVHCTSLNA
jgi:superfamily II DNA helicase RecQ